MTATAEKAETTAQKHPVDQVPPPGRLTALGLQHVLAMYAGAVAVPLIVGGALNQPRASCSPATCHT